MTGFYTWRCPKAICMLPILVYFNFSDLAWWLSKLKSWKSTIQRSRKFNVYWKKFLPSVFHFFKCWFWNYTYLLIYSYYTYRHYFFMQYFSLSKNPLSGPSHIHGISRSLANWCSQITYILKNDVNNYTFVFTVRVC